MVFHVKKEGPCRLGVVVTKKTGGAVVRNRWRRVIREVFRSERNRLSHHGDHLIIVKKVVTGTPDQSLKMELARLFSKVAYL